jgi:hypothetical protein
MKPLFIHSMGGLGDNIYQRPFVRGAVERGHDVWLDTPWPQLFEDIPNVHCVYAPTRLRTQARNQAIIPADRWEEPPDGAVRLRFGYGRDDLMTTTILGALGRCLPLARGQKLIFDLPPWSREPSPVPPEPGKRLAVIRPVTERKEWLNQSRNPRPEYLTLLAERLLADGWRVVSVADLAPGQEWLVGTAPPATLRYHAGELGVRGLLRLVASADLCVGGIGWLLPAAIAAGVPIFCVLGGNAGAGNRPERLTDRRLDTRRVGFAVPDHHCNCAVHRHTCNKTITGLEGKFDKFLSRIRPLDRAA